MKRFNENPSRYPDLVYHGTKLTNITSILDYGFLIPDNNTLLVCVSSPNRSETGLVERSHENMLVFFITCITNYTFFFN